VFRINNQDTPSVYATSLYAVFPVIATHRQSWYSYCAFLSSVQAAGMAPADSLHRASGQDTEKRTAEAQQKYRNLNGFQ